MAEEKKPINWSDKCWKDMLIYQRKMLWLDDTIKRLAVWLELRQGMTAIDIGCGLGYLGYTYWPYFGKGGHYIGVDDNLDNLKDAAQASIEWAKGGKAEFVGSSAYQLPFPDNSADWVMCQLIMIHLAKPEEALAEMVRITKPGGLIMCKEPDNLAASLIQHYWSLPDFDVEMQLLIKKIHIIANIGRIKLGQGDAVFGRKIPHALKILGLIDIDVRMNDKISFINPPYDTPREKDTIERIEKDIFDEKRRQKTSDRLKEQFMAGGGDPDEFDKVKKMADNLIPEMRAQIERGEYYTCGGYLFLVTKGRKPIS